MTNCSVNVGGAGATGAALKPDDEEAGAGALNPDADDAGALKPVTGLGALNPSMILFKKAGFGPRWAPHTLRTETRDQSTVYLGLAWYRSTCHLVSIPGTGVLFN